MPSIAAFLSFACIMSFTPGPNNIMALSSASAYGLRKGLRFCFGVLLGVLGLMTACALFGAALFRFLPDVEPTMRAVGAAYILWMAFGVWRSGSGSEDARLVPVNGVVSGMLLQFVNPKGILYGITAFSSFVLPYYDSFMALAVSIGVLSAVAYAGTCFWGAFWSRIPPFPPEPPCRRQREHGAPAGVVCRFPVYLIISNGCNPFPRPWAHSVIFNETALCPIKHGNRTPLSTRSRHDLNFPTPHQSKVFGRGGGGSSPPQTFLYRTFPRSTASGLRSSVLANTRTARAASVISRMA